LSCSNTYALARQIKTLAAMRAVGKITHAGLLVLIVDGEEIASI
jgi:hypothetical protein